MSLLIGESGGTKTDWLLCGDSGEERQLQTPGLQPSLLSEGILGTILREQVLPWLGSGFAGQVHFFGAGLGKQDSRYLMAEMLLRELKLAQSPKVYSDLEGAALAALGNDPGVVGILGTGSAAIRCWGPVIQRRRGGWGWLAGDEGGGVALGKTFVRQILNGEVDGLLCRAFEDFTGVKAEELLDRLYHQPDPISFLAGIPLFLAAHRREPEIQAVLQEQFRIFFDRYLLPLVEAADDRVVLVGGVARSFNQVLTAFCQDAGLRDTEILSETPIRRIAACLLAPPGSKD